MWKKWQLFCATNFQSLMYPCFAFCSILGIFPYRINASIFETSKQRYILSTVVSFVFCIYELIVLYNINITGTIKYKDVGTTSSHNCFHILGTFIIVVTFILSSSRMHLLQTIMNISSKLPLNSYRKLSRVIHTKDILGFLFLVAIVIFYYSEILNHWHRVLVPYVFILSFEMDMLYMNCVCILKACFKRIDDNLINLPELIINDEPHLQKRIYDNHKNSFLLMKLKALKKQHLTISDTVQMLNTIFDLHLLATIIMTFAMITFQLYFYIADWKAGIKINTLPDQNYNTASITIVIYFTIKILLIVWACETGKNQALKIGITVHDLLNNSSDKQIKDELKLFSLQILQYENSFSTKGFIMDTTLLIAIMTNITTYLVSLIQYLITAYLCNEKIANNVA